MIFPAHSEALLTSGDSSDRDSPWLYPAQAGPRGMRALGEMLGTLLHEADARPGIVVGHDRGPYNAAMKQALVLGLMMAGCRVMDAGLAVAPGFCGAVVAIVGHNGSDRTGVRIMGTGRKEIALPDVVIRREGGSYRKYDRRLKAA